VIASRSALANARRLLPASQLRYAAPHDGAHVKPHLEGAGYKLLRTDNAVSCTLRANKGEATVKARELKP
jgi:hypothetical protein